MRKIKDILKAAALLCLACRAAYASDGGFSAHIAASTLDPKMEWWFNLPADSAPNIVETPRVYFHQNFSVFPFFEKAAVRDGNFDIQYSVYSIAPDGRRTKVSDNISLKGKKAGKDIIVASTEYVAACFDRNSPEGLYTFEIEARDKTAKKSATAKTTVRLSEWVSPIPMTDKKLVADTILKFYENPSPDVLYSLFFSNEFDLEQKGAPNDLNFINLGFVRAAFKRNEFLLSPIRESFAQSKPLDRAKIIFLFAILDEARVDDTLLTPAERKYQDAMRKADIPDPYKEWDTVLGAAQIDMLTGEFLADGTFRPIRRIMDLLSYVDEAKFAQKMMSERKKPADRDEMKKMMLGLYHIVALKSLLTGAERFPLLKKYCQWAIENKALPNSTYELLGGIAKEQPQGK